MPNHVLRLTQLSASLAFSIGAHAAEQASAPHSVSVLRAASINTPRPSGGSMAVTSCLDDSSAGTLRSVVAAAPGGTSIDMSGLTCSTITLTQGEIGFHASDLRFHGPAPDMPGGAPKLTINAAYQGRAFHTTDDTGGNTYFFNLRIVNGLVSRDDYAGGGCVSALAGVYANNVVFENCEGTGPQAAGGAIFAVNRVTLKHSTLSGNRVIAVTHSGSMASTRIALGGAIYVVGDVHVYDSTISGNFARLGANGNNAPVSYAYAGGISTAMANFGQEVVISGSTISGNQSDQKAGGLQLLGSVLVRNSTISGNSASFAGGMNVPDGTLTLQNSTIAFNSANKAAGIYCTMPTITSDSTIIANNTVVNMQFAPDLAHASSALMVSGADNLIMTWDASTAFASLPMTLDPGLLPLAHNGGPTMTHALPVSSPAVDAGNNVAGVRYDQRGYKYPRDVNGRADIGAYEWLERVFADGFE